MAAARKSNAAKPKKSVMPRLLVGVWLIALTVLLVIMFTNMPEKRNGSPGKPLVKPISVPPAKELQAMMKDMATRSSVDQLEKRVDTVEEQTARIDAIGQKVDEHDGDIAVLDQRVNRLETTVSDRLNLPSRSFSDIPTPPKKETPEPTPAPDEPPAEPAEKTADQPTPETSPKEKAVTPAAPESPDAGKTAPSVAARQPEVTARPEPGMETPAKRRAVQRKIAAREAYIRRTAPLRRTGEWTPPPTERPAVAVGDRAIGPPSRVPPDRYAADRPVPIRPPGAGMRGVPLRAPTGSLHYLGNRFGHRVDLSAKVNGGLRGGVPEPDTASTAPGMTIFPDRRLDVKTID